MLLVTQTNATNVTAIIALNSANIQLIFISYPNNQRVKPTNQGKTYSEIVFAYRELELL